MSFCTKCGRPRSGNTRFCTTCGAQFEEDPAAASWAAETQVVETPAADVPATWDQPQPPAVTPPPAQTRLEAPPPDDPWLASNTQSLLLPPAPAVDPWAREPSPVPPVFTAPPESWQPPSGRGRKTALIVAATVVLVLAAGGGAFALVSSVKGHTAAGPTTHPTVAASHSAATTAPATPTPSATPSASQTPTPTMSPSPASSGMVSVAPGVSANPAAPPVTAYLNRYFNAINSHNYQEWSSLLDAQMQADNTQASFTTGYGTTTDSAETLTAISGTGGGGEAATVSFTSRQNPAHSIDDSPCTNWTITLFLEPQGSSYVDTPPPSSYHSAYSAC